MYSVIDKLFFLFLGKVMYCEFYFVLVAADVNTSFPENTFTSFVDEFLYSNM
jgi:hypothetical protein